MSAGFIVGVTISTKFEMPALSAHQIVANVFATIADIGYIITLSVHRLEILDQIIFMTRSTGFHSHAIPTTKFLTKSAKWQVEMTIFILAIVAIVTQTIIASKVLYSKIVLVDSTER
jgi:acetolactate synthase regulatory subunit